jgi:hypothetical protein
VAEVRHRRLDANPRLAGVGEDRQQGDRFGVKVDGLDPVGLQDRQEEGENGGTRPAKTEKRKKGWAIAGRVSRSVRPCQMRVAPHSLFLLPTISRTVWSSRLLLMRDSSRGAAGCGAASEVLAAPMALRGAMASGQRRVAAGGWKAKGIWVRKFFGKGGGGGDVL